LFEHDIYFQSIARGLRHMLGLLDRTKAALEYLRALRYELRILRRFDQVQVCTAANRAYLESFLPALGSKIEPGLRAGIDTEAYRFRSCGREPATMLFLGSFRHEPNRVALEWFIREILPVVRARSPEARLVVVGSDPPPPWAYGELSNAIELQGFVEDVREPLSRYSVFVCPIRSGSGVRVKLLEAFASGIPTVSTRLGAEGLAGNDGEFCMLADEPEEFAAKIVQLLENPAKASELAARARAEVAANWDMAAITRKLEMSYRQIVRDKRLRQLA
jgi:glycosyltransferase involved in cell wall biosynthesis